MPSRYLIQQDNEPQNQFAPPCNLYNYRDKKTSLLDYISYMLSRTQRIFKYNGLPDTIPQRMLEMQLQLYGFSCIGEYAGELYAFRGGLGGEPDVYYKPTICTVANPALKMSKTFHIDKDCVIMRNDSYLQGMLPMFRKYATAMVENDISFDILSKNARVSALITAPDDTTKKAGEKYLDDISEGKVGVLASNEFLDGVKVQPLASVNQRSMTELIEYMQYIKASWYNEIGLNANYNMKRESLTTTEAQMNFDALIPLVDDMLESRRETLEKVNKMFGLNISVELSSSWEKINESFQALGTEPDSEAQKGGEENERDDTETGVQQNNNE